MDYKITPNGNFIVFEGRSYKVDRKFFNDADDTGNAIMEAMFERLSTRRSGLSIVTVGDTNFAVTSFPIKETFEHSVALSEVRTDGRGIEFKKPIPFLKGNSHVPLIHIVGLAGECKVNLNPVMESFGSVARIVQQSCSDALARHKVEETL